MAQNRPEWQLPPGVSPGSWRYMQADHIADDYDDYFAGHALFELDEQILRRYFDRPGVLIDLGCGTGRSLEPFARKGFTCIGVDLSLPMLRVVREKARSADLPMWPIQANLVELTCLRENVADYGVCLFSTIGMIRGRENRLAVLKYARRIVRPGGIFVFHAHNFWVNLFDPGGRRWLVRHLLKLPFSKNVERGDKFYPYRGVSGMFLHTFTRRELTGLVRQAGFKIEELIPLDAARMKPLRRPWLMGRFRANGWIVVCRVPED